MRRLALLILMVSATAFMQAQSVYTAVPDDPNAVTLASPNFSVHADGIADDSDALQQAIDRVQETVHHGIVFIPAGHYRLTKTIHVWAGIRLIGCGEERPVFLLAPNTPGFQTGSERDILWFTDERPKADQPIGDASEFTFYSALSNIDFEIGEGNAAAVAIRFNVAQHSFISHASFHLGTARAAIEHAGNQASDISVEGGQFGIITGKTSPAWQFLLMDSNFRGQSIAAIRTQEAGMTLIRDRFAHVPVAIEIPKGEVEQLYGRDLHMEDISDTALKLGDVQNLRSEITLEKIVCERVKQFAAGLAPIAKENAITGPSRRYYEERLRLGLEIGPDGRERGITAHHKETSFTSDGEDAPDDIPVLPSMSAWVNVHTLGAKGDGGTDDTAALQHAIDEHAVLYFPSGFYRLTGSLHLRADSVLIGLHPFATQLILHDHEEHFQGEGAAIPLLVAPKGGHPIVTSIGIATGNGNPRAAGIEWLAGSHSLLDDVSLIRWRSEYVAALEPAVTKPNFQPGQPGAPRPQIDLDAQYPSLWIHDGGGGILRGIWSHAGTAKGGLLIEKTSTPGVIYQFSCEHHMRNEVRFDHAANWRVYALQTEEEKSEGADADAIEIESSHDLVFANTYMYRVSRNVMPKPYAVIAHDSTGILFDNVKVFSQTRLAFDNSIFDQNSGVTVRAHDFTHLALTSEMRPGAALPPPAAFAADATLQRVATGYSNASGLTPDGAGAIYFSDAVNHAIYRYDETKKQAELVVKSDATPMSLAFVAPSSLIAINAEKSVSSMDLKKADLKTNAISPVDETATTKPETRLLLPVGLHNELIQLTWMLAGEGYVYRLGSNTARRSELVPEHRGYYYAPDSTTAIMAGGTWRPLLQSAQLAPFAVGDQHYITSEDDARTWLGTLTSLHTLLTQLFTERGGTSVVSDAAGNVYIAGSQVYIYDRAGKQTGILEIPERPTSLCFGGADHRTLFIGARSSIYAIRTNQSGK